MKQVLIWILGFMLAPGMVLAADLQVVVRDASGATVENAVVTYTPSGGATIKPADLKGPFVMAQKDVKFAPYVLAVPKGAVVGFPNLDRVNHHVYSFSPANKFQLPLYGKGITRNITFANAGTAALGCNIHDKMTAYIRVVDTPFYAKSTANGTITLKGVPEGAGTLSVWHPLMAAAGNEVTQPARIAKANAPVAVSIKLRPRGAQ